MVRAIRSPLLISALLSAACGVSAPAPAPGAAPSGAAPPTTAATSPLDLKIAQFAPVDIGANVAALPANEQQAVSHMVKAARIMDGLFLQQVWAGNPSLLVQLGADRTPQGQAELHYFLINKGPWARTDHNAVFVRPDLGVPAKPEQANFYPDDATKDEVDKWISSLTGAAKAQATGFFTLVRRGADGKLMLVPYNVAYRQELVAAADHLKAAAAATTQPSLKKFLDLRAQAFLSNDYFASDMAWMELDASIEPTIGPYETYEDGWFGYKAAFEAFITLKDDVETNKLASFSGHLQELENALPIDPKYRNPKLGALAPIRVVNVVFAGGDGNRGVQTAAFNLPNDDRVVKEKGSKRVMLKNVQDAKFQKVLLPIAAVALPAADRSKVSFDAFFTHILMHEMLHGIGPQQVHATGDGLRQALKENASALEEAKADIAGLWGLQRLADANAISPEIARTMYTTYLASMFRSIRFGLTEAHGKGVALQMNSLLDQGAVVVNADGTFSIVDAKIKDAVANLAKQIMTIQAEGNYQAAKDLLTKMAVNRPEVQKVLDRLKDVPIDIEPRFVSAK
jgi:hypothetical protein